MSASVVSCCAIVPMWTLKRQCLRDWMLFLKRAQDHCDRLVELVDWFEWLYIGFAVVAFESGDWFDHFEHSAGLRASPRLRMILRERSRVASGSTPLPAGSGGVGGRLRDDSLSAVLAV